MSSVIRIKRSSTPGSIPSGLSTGELAINLIDGKLYVGANSSTTRLVGGVQLANTNLAIARINTNLTGTNTAIRLLVADRLQVANAVATYATKVNPTTSGLLAHTGRATISTNLAVSGNTTLSGLIANGSLGSSNYTLRTNGTSVYWAPGGGSTTKYLEVANAVATFQTIATERAALANTNTFIATKVNTTTFNSALANTNTFIATKVNTTTFNSALANTNSYIAANALIERQHLANTNTFIATKVNTTTFNSALANTNTFIATKVNTTTFNSALANTNSYIAAGDLLERQHLANTNTFIATKVNTTTFNSALANTNAFIKAQLANTNVFIGTKVSTSTFNAALANTNTNYATKVYVNAAVDALVNAAPTLLNTLKELSSAIGDDANFAATIATSLGTKASNTYVKTLLANTNAYIATKVNTTTFNSALANTNSFIAANALIERQHLANTNASITNVKSGLTATNTAIRLLVADRLQVANAAATYQTKATERAALANTNAFIAANALVERQHLANTNSFIAANALIERQHLANTNAYIASVATAGVSKYLEVANAVATFQTKATERAALANTNTFIATKVNTTTFNSALANTNTFIATKVNTTTFNSALANTNVFIKAQLANTNSYIAANALLERQHLANTNANYATKVYVNAAVDALVNAAPTLLNTLKELSSAIGDDANFATTIATNLGTKASNTYVKTLLANTNAYIATKVNTTTFNSALANTNSYIAANALIERQALANTNARVTLVNTNLTGTNTAIRTLVADRLQVANAAALYQTKATERAALANTNSYIAANALVERQHLANTNARVTLVNTNLTGTNTAIRLLVADRLQVANAVATFQTKATERAALANTNAFIAAGDLLERQHLANTNAFIKSQLANTNTFIATKVNTTTFNSALANTNSYIAAGDLLERQHLANTNSFIAANALIERQHLANTNTFIATKVNTTTFNSALANTNAFIKAQLANTNVSIATKVSTTTFNAALANTNTNYATKVYVNAAVDALVNAAPTLLNTLKELSSAIGDDANFATTIATSLGAKASNTYVKTLLANTNAYIATKVNTTTFNSALANTNAFIKSQLANTNSFIAANALVERQHLANTNTFIATKTSTTTFNSALANTNAFIKSQLANTNSYINTKANATNPTTSGVLAHTGRATISTNLTVSGNTVINGLVAGGGLGTPNQVLRSNGTTAYWSPGQSANVIVSTSLVSALTQNDTVVTSLTDISHAYTLTEQVVLDQYLQVANAAALFDTITNQKSQLANTNAFIKAQLANTNAYIATKVNTTTFNSALANTNTFIATKVSTSTFNSALANTNTYIATKLSNAWSTTVSTRNLIPEAANTYSLGSPTRKYKDLHLSGATIYLGNTTLSSTRKGTLTIAGQYGSTQTLVSNAYLTSTFIANTTARTLIADRLQVANAVATFQTKATERAALANTNAAITNVKSGLTATNTAIRTLVADRLQVANAAATYATKVNPTTSGLLAHTGRATISTNLTVSGNTNVSGNMTIDGNLDVNGSLTYINSTTVTVGDNMIKLANTNRSDVIDTGVYSRYTSSGTKYTGVIRDATDGVYKFFYNLSTEPNQTIDFGTATIATIEAVIDGGEY